LRGPVGRPRARLRAVVDLERAEVDILDRRVADAGEVAGGGGAGRDSDEKRLVGGRLDAKLRDEPRGELVDVHRVADDRASPGLIRVRAGRDVAAVGRPAGP